MVITFLLIVGAGLFLFMILGNARAGRRPRPTPTIRGEPLRCVVCGGSAFAERRALLNTAGLTFLNLDWANREATCLVCDTCGFVHWFAR